MNGNLDTNDFLNNNDCRVKLKHRLSFEEAFEKLQNIIQSEKMLSRDITINSHIQRKYQNWKFLQLLSVCRCLEIMCCDNEGITKASARVAEIIYGKKSIFSYKARSIAKWTNYYCDYGLMQTYVQGRHTKTSSIITDENVQQKLKICLRDMKDEMRTPDEFMNLLNKTVLQQIINAPEKISLKTANRWMRYLGFNPTAASKGWFTDGHERPDVIEDREAFLM